MLRNPVMSQSAVHVLGNAQELVKADTDADDGGYAAAGGTFSDPIERCLVETHRSVSTQGDDTTGFRLVREVS